ncbi:MAG: PqqD family protein [Bacteroidales bacterium]|nr:PqqD family protein [Bacteroidales bacterium]
MKIKEGFTLRTLCGEHIVVGEGLSQVNFNKIISLNESAAWLWEQVQGKEFGEETLAGLLLEKYDVSQELAQADSAKLLEQWKEQGIIEE